MWHYIYRQRADGSVQEIGRALYLSDAEQILHNWHSGYIIKDGNILLEKNLTLKEKA